MVSQQRSLLGADVTVEIALCLRSTEASRLQNLCKSCRTILGQIGPTGLGASGKHDRNGLWLHGVLDWQLLRLYVQDMCFLTCLDTFHFSSFDDVVNLMAAAHEEKTRVYHRQLTKLSRPSCFLTQWKFDAPRASKLIKGQSTLPVRSDPKRFDWDHGQFEVALVISRCSENSFRIRWQAVFLETAPDAIPLDVEVSGGIIASFGRKNVSEILPWYPFCNKISYDASTHVKSPADIMLGDSTLNQLVCGQPLQCFLSIYLRVQDMADLHIEPCTV